jgi:CRP-like cAMP-binding protein
MSRKTKNSILQALSDEDFRLIEPHLDRVDLPVRTRLETRNARVSALYFIESGITSIVSHGDVAVEVGMIGSEGVTGIAVVLESDLTVPTEAYMQVAGEGQAISADAIRAAINESRTLHRCLLRYAHQLYLQTVQTALANVTGSMEQRLARWLLMVHDRVGTDDIPLTHQFMAVMLGVQRSGVSLCLQSLEKAGAIAQHRGAISVLRRRALLEIARNVYQKDIGMFPLETTKNVEASADPN